jgi:ADP-heptose:LPS heptosyltransferase
LCKEAAQLTKMATGLKKINFRMLVQRHMATLGYVLNVLLPIIVRTGRRPVIFSRWTGMGDIICTIPAARALMKRHIGALFIYNCHRDFTVLPKIAGVADRITSLEQIGLIGHWYRFLLAGFYPFAHGDDTPGQMAQAPMVAEFLRQFNLPVTEGHPEIMTSATAQEKVLTLLRQKQLDPEKLVLIHPGPSWPIKEWPREHWTQLVARLRAAGHTNIAQMGVARYMNFGKVALEAIPGAVSLIDELSVEECFAIIARAKLLIGIDSGLLHISGCTHTPAIGVFGPTSPQFFYSENIRKEFAVSQVACQGCYHRRPRVDWITGCPHDIRCMVKISADEVLRNCLEILEKPNQTMESKVKII